MIRPAETADLAREMLTFADGIDAAADLGDHAPEYARRARNLARAALETAENAANEESCRRSLQQRIETLEGIVMRLHAEFDQARASAEAEV